MNKDSYLNDLSQATVKIESFDEESFETVKGNHKKTIVGAILLVIVVAIVYIYLSLPVKMIDLVNQNIAFAMDWAQKNHVSVEINGVFHEEIEADMIIDQSKEPEKTISKNETILLTVSQGINPEKIIELPAFDSNWTKTSIATWVIENKLTNYQFINESSPSVETNHFIRYEITDSIFKRDSKITIYIAN